MAVTMKNLQEQIVIHDVERDARARWDRQRRRSRRLEQWIVRGLPFAVLIMAIVFYTLSAPHTAGILDLITPGWGRYAPIGWELGILAIAALIEVGARKRIMHAVLYTLLVMAIVINVAGAFIAVTEYAAPGAAGVADATFADLLARYGGLPARYQVVLLLVVPVGAVIPVIAKLTGEIIIRLALGSIKLERTSDDVLWARDAHKVMHAALMQAALACGAGVKTASGWALSVADNLYAYRPPLPPDDARAATLPAPTPAARAGGIIAFHEMSARHLGQMGQLGQSQTDFENIELSQTGGKNALNAREIDRKDSPDAGQSQLSQRVSKRHVGEWLAERPELLARSDRDIARLYMQDVFGMDSDSAYKTVQRARKDIQAD